MYICLCQAVNEKTVHEAIESGHHDVDAIGDVTGAGTCCGGCRQLVQILIDDHHPRANTSVSYYEVA